MAQTSIPDRGSLHGGINRGSSPSHHVTSHDAQFNAISPERGADPSNPQPSASPAPQPIQWATLIVLTVAFVQIGIWLIFDRQQLQSRWEKTNEPLPVHHGPRVTLSASDFRTLVGGGSLPIFATERRECCNAEICLQDIGFSEMRAAIDQAQEMQSDFKAGDSSAEDRRQRAVAESKWNQHPHLGGLTDSDRFYVIMALNAIGIIEYTIELRVCGNASCDAVDDRIAGYMTKALSTSKSAQQWTVNIIRLHSLWLSKQLNPTQSKLSLVNETPSIN